MASDKAIEANSMEMTLLNATQRFGRWPAPLRLFAGVVWSIMVRVGGREKRRFIIYSAGGISREDEVVTRFVEVRRERLWRSKRGN